MSDAAQSFYVLVDYGSSQVLVPVVKAAMASKAGAAGLGRADEQRHGGSHQGDTILCQAVGRQSCTTSQRNTPSNWRNLPGMASANNAAAELRGEPPHALSQRNGAASSIRSAALVL